MITITKSPLSSITKNAVIDEDSVDAMVHGSVQDNLSIIEYHPRLHDSQYPGFDPILIEQSPSNDKTTSSRPQRSQKIMKTPKMQTRSFSGLPSTPSRETIIKPRIKYHRSRPRLVNRPPRIKAEAIGEISMIIDKHLPTNWLSHVSDLQKKICLRIEDLAHDNLITWRRLSYDSNEEVSCPFALLILDAGKVYSEVKSGSRDVILSFLSKLKNSLPNTFSKICLLIIGGNAFFKKIDIESHRGFKSSIRTGAPAPSLTEPVVTWLQLEQSLWLGGLGLNLDIQFLERPQQLADLLLEMTKCIAWEPYAHRHEMHKFCVAASKNTGKSLTETWKLMLQEITRVTPSVADAITRIYPTIKSLLSRYKSLSQFEAADLLAKVPVTARRTIGPALSRRIYHTLTSTDPAQMANS